MWEIYCAVKFIESKNLMELKVRQKFWFQIASKQNKLLRPCLLKESFVTRLRNKESELESIKLEYCQTAHCCEINDWMGTAFIEIN